MSTYAIVKAWHEGEGWGVLDPSDAEEHVWVHFSALHGDIRDLVVGQAVWVEWERAEQDGYHLRATSVRPMEGYSKLGQPPENTGIYSRVNLPKGE